MWACFKEILPDIQVPVRILPVSAENETDAYENSKHSFFPGMLPVFFRFTSLSGRNYSCPAKR